MLRNSKKLGNSIKNFVSLNASQTIVEQESWRKVLEGIIYLEHQQEAIGTQKEGLNQQLIGLFGLKSEAAARSLKESSRVA